MNELGDVFFHMHQATVWRGDTAALRHISLELRMGESVAVLGPNGAGKSTLLKVLTGELRAAWSEGSACRLFGQNHWSLESLRSKLGVVMPEEIARFEPSEPAYDVVLSACRGAYGRVPSMRFRREEMDRAHWCMEIMSVAHLADRPFAALSSGEKRRLLVARACVHEPDVLVLDEPTTALDFGARTRLSELLRDLMQDGQTLIWVTHDPGEIPPELNRVLLLHEGSIIADGPKYDVLKSKGLSDLFDLDLRVRWNRGWCDVRPR